jgi:hypothetical protein
MNVVQGHQDIILMVQTRTPGTSRVFLLCKYKSSFHSNVSRVLDGVYNTYNKEA